MKRFCEAQVVEWLWYTREVYEPTPYELLIAERRKGRRMKTPPPRDDGRDRRVQYGVDAQGRFVVERCWNKYTHGYNEQFLLWQTPLRLETVYYHLESGVAAVGGWYCPPYNAKRILHDDDGRVTRVDSANREGEAAYTYTYDDGRLVRINGSWTATLEYDQKGRLVATVSHGRRKVLKPK